MCLCCIDNIMLWSFLWGHSIKDFLKSLFFLLFTIRNIFQAYYWMLLANIPSPLGFADIIFGTLATTLATIVMYKVSNLYIGAIAGAVINGIIVGGELYFILHLPFFMNMFYVFVGEFIDFVSRMFSI